MLPPPTLWLGCSIPLFECCYFFFFYSISKAPNHFHLLHKEIQSLLAKVTVPSPGIPFTVITGKKWLFILTTLIIIAQIRINSEKTENNNWVFDNFKFHSLFLKGGLMSDVRCDALKLCHSSHFWAAGHPGRDTIKGQDYLPNL